MSFLQKAGTAELLKGVLSRFFNQSHSFKNATLKSLACG